MRALHRFNKLSIIKGHHLPIALICILLSSNASASKPFYLDSLSSQQVWLASHVLPGSGQVINKQYWKIPVFYAGMGSMIYLGVNANSNYRKIMGEYQSTLFTPEGGEHLKRESTLYKIERNACYAGAAAFYLASVADALIVKAKGRHSPATATILSALVPGMGQVYNQKPWKVPVIYGGIASLYYIVDFNQRGFVFFKTAYEQLIDPNQEDVYGGQVLKEELIWRRDLYRRNRDMAIIGLAGLYVLNIIDANVDAHFFDWDISDNLALGIEPVLNGGISAHSIGSAPNFGVRLKFDF